MASYTLFGREIAFLDSAERYIDLQRESWLVIVEARRKFSAWYAQCKGIEGILDGYPAFVEETLRSDLLAPLYRKFVECGIYDVGEATYQRACLKTEASALAHEELKARCSGASAVNPDGSVRMLGGGIGTALAASVEMGVKSVTAGVGVNVVSLIGGFGSAIIAGSQKSKLYHDAQTAESLAAAMDWDIIATIGAHADLLNQYRGDYIANVFDMERGEALFENAKRFPDKREELLVQSFVLYPWDPALADYIAKNDPAERENIEKIIERFSIVLPDEQAAQPDAAPAPPQEQPAEQPRNDSFVSAQELRQSEPEPAAPLGIKPKKPEDAASSAAYLEHLYLGTDLASASAVAAARATVEQLEQTPLTRAYAAAFAACDEKNLAKARAYQKRKSHTLRRWIIGIAASLFLLILSVPLGVAFAVVYALLGARGARAWRTLTMGGKVVHPALEEKPKQK